MGSKKEKRERKYTNFVKLKLPEVGPLVKFGKKKIKY